MNIDDAHEVRFLHDDEFLSVELDLGPGPFPEKDPVAGPDVQRTNLAVLRPGAGSGGDDLALLGLLLGGIGNDDAASGLLLLRDAADQDAVTVPEVVGGVTGAVWSELESKDDLARVLAAGFRRGR